MLPAPIYFSSFNFWKCPGWKKGKFGFFGGSCLIVNFLPFFCYIFQRSCFWGCDLTYLQFWTRKLCINGEIIEWFGLEGGFKDYPVPVPCHGSDVNRMMQSSERSLPDTQDHGASNLCWHTQQESLILSLYYSML